MYSGFALVFANGWLTSDEKYAEELAELVLFGAAATAVRAAVQ